MVSSLIPSARKLALVLAAGAAFSAAMLWNGKAHWFPPLKLGSAVP
jgi:hypothetical protein